MLNYSKCCALFLCLCSFGSYALTGEDSCRVKVNTSMTNLESSDSFDKSYIKTEVETLLADPKNDAYALSMPLLISSQLGNKELYHSSMDKMNKAMEQVASGPFKAWLYGRMLLAAHSMNDSAEVTKIQSALKSVLESLNKDESTRSDRFTVWSLGYLAALNKGEFDAAKQEMTQGADHLTKNYLDVNASTASVEKKQEARSDALWAWVLIAQAAANSNDKSSYDNALNQMLFITQQSSVGEALSKGLLRTAASNDYPAWALGIVKLAAQTIGDKAQYSDIGTLLDTSINSAKSENKIQETLLAMVNSYLALERQNNIDQCGKGS